MTHQLPHNTPKSLAENAMNRAKHATRLLCGEVLIAGIPGPALTADAQQPVLLEPADEWRVERPKDGVKP